MFCLGILIGRDVTRRSNPSGAIATFGIGWPDSTEQHQHVRPHGSKRYQRVHLFAINKDTKREWVVGALTSDTMGMHDDNIM